MTERYLIDGLLMFIMSSCIGAGFVLSAYQVHNIVKENVRLQEELNKIKENE